MRRPLLFASLFVFGCSPGAVELGVAVSPRDTSTQALSSDPSSASDAAPGLAGEGGVEGRCTLSGKLQLDRVRILVKGAKLERGCGHMKHHDPKQGPFVITLTGCEIASGAAKAFATADFPAGAYEGSVFKVAPLKPKEHRGCGMRDGKGARPGKPEGMGERAGRPEGMGERGPMPMDGDDDDAPLPPEAEDFAAAHASMLVDGAYDGRPFTFAARFKARQARHEAVEVKGDGAVPLTLAVDPKGWFLDEAGAPLDPTLAENHTAVARSLCLGIDDGGGDRHHGEGHDRDPAMEARPGEPAPRPDGDGPKHPGKGVGHAHHLPRCAELPAP